MRRQVKNTSVGKIVAPATSSPPSEWNKWWVRMWVAIAVGLIIAAPFMYVWDWWLAVLIAFGVPEFIGARVQNDSFPPLTHVIVRYVNPEISVPFMVGMAGGMGSYWLGAEKPFWRGLLFGLVGWFLVHFLLRYIPHRSPMSTSTTDEEEGG